MKLRGDGKNLIDSLVARFRSDELAELRHIVAMAQRQLPSIQLPPRLYLVPDTNCILKELDYSCRRRLTPGRSALEEVVDAGLVRLFAPMELEAEVLEHIPDIAAHGKRDPAAYFAEWERYKKKIHLFRAEDDARVDIADPDDACFIRASRIVAADAIITDDEIVLDAAVSIRPPVVHGPLRQVSRDEAVRLGLSVQGMLVATISGGVLKRLVTSIARRPKIGIPILLAVGLAAFLYDRKAVRETGTSAIREVLRATGRGLVSIMSTINERSASATKNLGAVGGEGRTARQLESTVLATLIAEGKPMGEADVVSNVQIEGFNPWVAWPQKRDDDYRQRISQAWIELGLHVANFLRSDPRCFWTGTGWTTRLLLSQRSASSIPVAQQHAHNGRTVLTGQLYTQNPVAVVGVTTSADTVALGPTQNSQRPAPPRPKRKERPVRTKGTSNAQPRKKTKAPPKVIRPGKTKARKRLPRRKS
jgi:hypothetical protein